ncbi:MAG: MFS transporter [Pseudomonadota bacterium]|nr:MFS transporter [Pseudomonadota bacterium]
MTLVYGAAVLPLSFELPALSLMGNAFHLSNANIKSAITLFWAMFTLGQFISAFYLPRLSINKMTTLIVTTFIGCFILNAMTHSGYIFFLLRTVEGACCGSLLLLGRYSMANMYGSNEKQYLTQFASLSSMLTALSVLVPILSSLMIDYLHWRLIYFFITSMGVTILYFKKDVFLFQQPKLTNFKEDFMVVLGDNFLMCKSFLGGFSRSIIINFNTNLALFLLNYKHWSSLRYALLVLFFSLISILSRLFLTWLRNIFGYELFNHILMMILLCASLLFLNQTLLQHDMIYFLAGAMVTMSSSLLSTLYSATTQFRLAKQRQAMSLAIMGVLQNSALVLGTFLSIFLPSHSLFYLVELIVFSCLILFVVDWFANMSDKQYQSFTTN